MYTKATNCGTVGVEVVLFWLSDLCKSSQETIGAILVPSCIEAWTLHPSSPLERGAVRGAGSHHGGVHAAASFARHAEHPTQRGQRCHDKRRPRRTYRDDADDTEQSATRCATPLGERARESNGAALT